MQFSPVLTSHKRDYVHHVIVYLCSSPLTPEEANMTVRCDDLPDNVGQCRRQQIIAAWAVGGEVSNRRLVITGRILFQSLYVVL